MASRSKRIMKEIHDCQKDAPVTQIDIEMLDEDLSHLRGRFPGPPNSPYEGGTFEVSIEVPPSYPFEPLKMKFITKVYHPNVSSQSGAICLDILKDAWSPVLTLKTTLVSLQSLLCSPEPNDPQDAEVAKVYLTDKAAFERTATYWTEIYANGKSIKSPMRTPSVKPSHPHLGSSILSHHQDPPHQRTSSSSNSSPLSSSPRELIRDEIISSGLNLAYVEQFENMGFATRDIIKVMIELDYRGKKACELGEESVIEALLQKQ